MKREKFLMQLNMGHSKMITTSKEDYLQIWNAIQARTRLSHALLIFLVC